MIGGGKKLNFGKKDRCDWSRGWGRRGSGGEPSEQRVLLDLSDQTVVIEALSIAMQETVKLRAHREGKSAYPQHEHQTGDPDPDARARMLCYVPELQSQVTMHQI